MVLDDVRERVSVMRVADTMTVRRNGETWRLQLSDPMAAAAEEDDAGGRLVAPIPGQVTQVAAEPGMAVVRGQVMVVLEAMKTVFRLTAPADGVVATVSCRAGDSVVEGQLLVGFAEGDSPPHRNDGCCINRHGMTTVGGLRPTTACRGSGMWLSREEGQELDDWKESISGRGRAGRCCHDRCDSSGHARCHRDRDQDRQHSAVQRTRIVLRRARQAGERILRHGERAGRRRRSQDQFHLAGRQLQPAEDGRADSPPGRAGGGRIHLRRLWARRPTARSCAT